MDRQARDATQHAQRPQHHHRQRECPQHPRITLRSVSQSARLRSLSIMISLLPMARSVGSMQCRLLGQAGGHDEGVRLYLACHAAPYHIRLLRVVGRLYGGGRTDASRPATAIELGMPLSASAWFRLSPWHGYTARRRGGGVVALAPGRQVE
jgi:hypothetical protein